MSRAMAMVMAESTAKATMTVRLGSRPTPHYVMSSLCLRQYLCTCMCSPAPLDLRVKAAMASKSRSTFDCARRRTARLPAMSTRAMFQIVWIVVSRSWGLGSRLPRGGQQSEALDMQRLTGTASNRDERGRSDGCEMREEGWKREKGSNSSTLVPDQ